MISKYQATHEKTHLFNFVGEDRIKQTFMNRIANLINSSWIYSLHWVLDDYKWIDQAMIDVEIEIKHADERMSRLKEAKRLLDLIENDKQ